MKKVIADLVASIRLRYIVADLALFILYVSTPYIWRNSSSTKPNTKIPRNCPLSRRPISSYDTYGYTNQIIINNKGLILLIII